MTLYIYHKTTRRDMYDRALQAATDGGDVLLWNEDGYITETSIANVIVRIDGERCTTPGRPPSGFYAHKEKYVQKTQKFVFIYARKLIGYVSPLAALPSVRTGLFQRNFRFLS